MAYHYLFGDIGSVEFPILSNSFKGLLETHSRYSSFLGLSLMAPDLQSPLWNPFILYVALRLADLWSMIFCTSDLL